MAVVTRQRSTLPSVVVFVFFSLLLLCFGLSLTLVCIRYVRVQDRYQVDARMFTEAVNLAVSNFLVSSVQSLPGAQPSRQAISSSSASFSYWQDIFGMDHAIIDGCEILTGDFFRDGRVAAISERAIYISTTNGYSIVRNSTFAPGGFADRSRASGIDGMPPGQKGEGVL